MKAFSVFLLLLLHVIKASWVVSRNISNKILCLQTAKFSSFDTVFWRTATALESPAVPTNCVIKELLSISAHSNLCDFIMIHVIFSFFLQTLFKDVTFRKDVKIHGEAMLCCGKLFFFFWNMNRYFFEWFFLCFFFLKMGNIIPQKGTKTWHQRHYGRALWYSNYKRYICYTPKKSQLCK